MDELENLDFDVGEKKKSFFQKIKAAFMREAEGKRGDKFALACDLTVFAVGFILARCHLLFGARPLGLAFAAALPINVWAALGGIVVGSLTLGESGIIFAATSAITVFLRAVASDRAEGEPLFCEKIITRMSIAVLGGFISAVYGWFLDGLSEVTLLFGLSMILLPPTLTFVFSGAFSAGITAEDLLSSSDIFSSAGRDEAERHNALFFRVSVLALLFFITLSLSEVEFFGISAAYVFSTAVTLAVAKRFGSLHALAVGFVTALSVSAVYSVSFALLGVGAGIMFCFGSGYAVIIGGAAMAAWSSYSGGLVGFLTMFPEYLIGSVLVFPLLKKISLTERIEEDVGTASTAEDMVGTMALAFKNGYSGRLDRLESALASISTAIRGFSLCEELTAQDYRALVTDVAERICSECFGQKLCTSESIRPCINNSLTLAEKLFFGERITAEDVNGDTEFCAIAGVVAMEINREAERVRGEGCASPGTEWESEVCTLASRLVSEAIYFDSSETAVDESVTNMLTKVVKEAEIEDGIVRAFGERRRHILLACEDADGRKITSRRLIEGFESVLGLKLGAPEYFRRGRMVVMECDAVRAFSVKVAFASRAGSDTEVSGDSSACFESADDCFFSLISDGMGKGRVARSTSSFVTDFMKRALEMGADKETVIHFVNGIIRSRGAECSATVDLFELDLITGDATFVKSGAASSYVKRESSIFRIRSRTAPIGLMKTIDTEKIRVEIRDGDYVVMLSDGIVDSFDDAPWLLELLSREANPDVTEYAREILDLAVKNSTSGDDMSVTVIKIGRA